MGALAAFLLTGCAAVPEIAKVGLLAPFEGLYRASGYDALAAVRRGLEECAPAGMTLIPLALDSGATPEQARRAAAKLMLDPSVIAVIGPLDLAGAAAASGVMAAHDLPWMVPVLVDPQGGYTPSPSATSIAALARHLLQAQTPRPARLLVGGLPPDRQPDAWAENLDGVPVLLAESPAALLALVQPGDALLWLGLPDGAAELHQHLGAAGSDTTLWLGPAGGGAVFAAHTAAGPEARWLIWQESGYNGGSPPPDPSEAVGRLVYQATCAALAAAETGAPPGQPVWELHSYRLNAERVFIP